MKKIALLLLVTICTMSCTNDKTYKLTVSGDVSDNIVLILQTDHASRNALEIQASEVTDEKLVFTGVLEAPCMARLESGNNKSSSFILSNIKGKVTIGEDLEVIETRLGYQQEMKNDYDRLMQSDKKQELYTALRQEERGSEAYTSILEKVRELSKNDKDLQVSFIEEHPDAMMSPYALWRIYTGLQEDEAIRLFHLIDTNLQKQAQYMFVAPTILAWEKNPVGAEVPDLVQNDTTGKPVHLHSFKGKYLLIDFWASWCSPCRAANPEMVELYNKYHKKGFEILGVSLDKNREDWLKAIEDDGLVWEQVSDLKGWDNEISDYFGINSIPSTMLIGPDSRIIAKKLHADELDQKLKEILIKSE